MNLHCFFRGKRLTCSPLKSNYAQDVLFEKDVSISCTEKNDLVYVFTGVVDLRKTGMMQIRLKQSVLSKSIFSSCLSCFAEFISGEQ